jgi:hypothetical protein
MESDKKQYLKNKLKELEMANLEKRLLLAEAKLNSAKPISAAAVVTINSSRKPKQSRFSWSKTAGVYKIMQWPCVFVHSI